MNLSGAIYSGKWRRIAFVLVLSALLAELAGVRSVYDRIRGVRAANRDEAFYEFVATQIDEPRLCKKIPWAVTEEGGWLYAPSYERSECYAIIAGNTKNAWLCWKVKRFGAFNPLEGQTSMWSCWKRALANEHSGTGFAAKDLPELFSRMGYDPANLQEEGITPPIVSLHRIYRQLADRPVLAIRSKNMGDVTEETMPGALDQADLLKRIEKAIGGPDAPLPVTDEDKRDTAYLADLAATVSKDARWCLRISGDVSLAREKAGFRNWCLFKLAVETKDAQLCGQVVTPDDSSDPRLSLQAECLREVRSIIPTMVHYGPDVPASDDRTRTLLKMLNVPIPEAKDLPLETLGQACDRFLREVGKGSDVAHQKARQRLIERAQALQDAQ